MAWHNDCPHQTATQERRTKREPGSTIPSWEVLLGCGLLSCQAKPSMHRNFIHACPLLWTYSTTLHVSFLVCRIYFLYRNLHMQVCGRICMCVNLCLCCESLRLAYRKRFIGNPANVPKTPHNQLVEAGDTKVLWKALFLRVCWYSSPQMTVMRGGPSFVYFRAFFHAFACALAYMSFFECFRNRLLSSSVPFLSCV